jgi:hypothetical protein
MVKRSRIRRYCYRISSSRFALFDLHFLIRRRLPAMRLEETLSLPSVAGCRHWHGISGRRRRLLFSSKHTLEKPHDAARDQTGVRGRKRMTVHGAVRPASRWWDASGKRQNA